MNTIQTNFTTIEEEHEREQESKKSEEELFKVLFKSREIDYKNKEKLQSGMDKLNADVLKEAFEIKFKDENGRNIIHRAALE